jgi:hypothetical protein
MMELRHVQIAVVTAAAFASSGAEALTVIDPGITAFITSETRTVSSMYLKGDAVIEETGDAAPSPTSLVARTDTDLTDTLDVAPLPSGPGYARASIYSEGYSSAQINAQLNDSITDAPHELRATVTETTAGTSGSGGPLQLSLAFLVEDIFLEIWDYSGFTSDTDTANPFEDPSGAIGVQIRYEVQRDGETAYRAQTDYWGGRYGTNQADRLSNNVNGVDMAGATVSGFGLADFYGLVGEIPRGMTQDDKFVPDLNLGLVEPFGGFEITTILQARLLLPATALGAGGRVGIGDPSKVSGSGLGTISIGPAGPEVPTVPLPASLPLLALGLAGLGAVRSFWFRA